MIRFHRAIRYYHSDDAVPLPHRKKISVDLIVFETFVVVAKIYRNLTNRYINDTMLSDLPPVKQYPVYFSWMVPYSDPRVTINCLNHPNNGTIKQFETDPLSN